MHGNRLVYRIGCCVCVCVTLAFCV